jgi:hypothetical protein
MFPLITSSTIAAAACMSFILTLVLSRLFLSCLERCPNPGQSPPSNPMNSLALPALRGVARIHSVVSH